MIKKAFDTYCLDQGGLGFARPSQGMPPVRTPLLWKNSGGYAIITSRNRTKSKIWTVPENIVTLNQSGLFARPRLTTGRQGG